MIISRTPFRISFVGGGTDLRSFYKNNHGSVISASIDKFIYVVVKKQIGIVEHKYRINWSKVEFCNSIEEIEHPIVREALKLLNIDFPLEITTFADVPSNTGLGSSSSFAVGLLHALYALKGQMVTKATLARQAAAIEIEILGRPIGKQDHYAAAYGGLNVFNFLSNEKVEVEPVFCSPEVLSSLGNNLILFYTKLKRDAGMVLKKQNDSAQANESALIKMRDLVAHFRDAFSNLDSLASVGNILHEGWMLKRGLTDLISSSEIDAFYSKAINAGATGGKLLGAGGGGFLLFYVPAINRAAVKNALSDLEEIPIGFDDAGTRITYYDQTRI
jgi:D-glycero-alpha-D-manno-heptose-7-phosphate kinase